MQESHPSISGILETILYVDDIAAARVFYEAILGLRPHGMSSELGVGYGLDDQMLLLFNPALSLQPGRIVPSHGSVGAGHLAFRASAAELDAWHLRLEAHGVEIEQEHTWENGARSIYFRDPAGNSLEFVEAALWDLD